MAERFFQIPINHDLAEIAVSPVIIDLGMKQIGVLPSQ
jgi:hypothetical protein